MSATNEVLLVVDGVTVDFAGFKALDTFSMTLAAGETRVVIGPNGAGKSTLCDTIIGRVRPVDGRILFKGEDITALPEQAIFARGICRKFQAPGILAALTVRENLSLACRGDRRWWRSLGTGISAAEAQETAAILALVGLEHRAATVAGDLAHGEKQWLEIAMVVSTKAPLILLDEPTAGMGPADTSRTAGMIKDLGQSRAVLVIDHDMAFVEELAAPVTVLHQGRFLRQGSVAEVRADPEVVSVYLGHAA